MPELTDDELVALIDAGEVGAISLDTTAFDAASCDLTKRSLVGMAQFPAIGMPFLITDMVAGEVISHIARDAEEASQKLSVAISLVEKRWKVEGFSDGVSHLFDLNQSSADFAKSTFEKYVARVDATLIKASDLLDADQLVSDYLGLKPPFEAKENKKHEFPDAISLGELEAWAEAEDKFVLVVSRDGGWKRRAAVSERLICVSSPFDAYGVFNRADAHVARRFVDALAKGDNIGVSNSIDGALERFAENTYPQVDAGAGFHYDVEFEGLSFKSRDPDVNDAIVISSDQETVTVAFRVTATFEALASFTFLIRDEGEYFPVGDASVQRDVEVELTLTATISRDEAHEIEVFDVDYEASRYLTIDFGHVEPDYEADVPDDETWD